MVGQHAQGNMRPREAFPHCHACAAQNRSLRWARAASQRYSERPAVRQICKVSRLHNGCNKGSVNTQQDLSEWRTMYHGHGYHTWDHSHTLKLTQTWERTPVQEVQRRLMWRSYFKAFDPREVPQEQSNLVTYGIRDVKSLVEHFSNNYLKEEKETSIIAQWPSMNTRIVRQKAISPNDVFSNLLAWRPHGTVSFYWTWCCNWFSGAKTNRHI